MIKAQEVYQELHKIRYEIDRLLSKTSDGEIGDKNEYFNNDKMCTHIQCLLTLI